VTIKTRSRRRPRPCPEEATFLDLLRTTDVLSRGLVQALKAAELSPNQYNVLRILRGAPEGLPCGEIGNRMITRDPDITRLLDRLARRGLVARKRQAKDRRTVVTRITPAGRKLLSRLDRPVQSTHRRQLRQLGRRGRETLGRLLRICRKGVKA
jgi:DNA-binding MarR family transcriptional regulator